MLYHLLYPLRDVFFGFNVFRYITFRAAGASVTAFLFCIVLGPPIFRRVRRLGISENGLRDHAPALDIVRKQKRGTPTMGGLASLSALVVSTLLWSDPTSPFILLVLALTVWLGLVGFADDYLKFVMHSSRGLAASTKFFGQIVGSIGIALFLYFSTNWSRTLTVPFFKNVILDLGVFYIPFVMLVIISSSNAVNITDGVDGLAIGCVILVAVTYSIFSYLTGHLQFSEYLRIFYAPGSGELAIFCASLVGAGLGFLWYNCHPAEVFMGDTGSLALGGALGTIAVLTKKELVLLIAGGVFVVEATSVILQVLSYKMTGQRLFLMSPIHHHFNLKGWHESKVMIRFLIVGTILVFISLSTLKLR